MENDLNKCLYCDNKSKNKYRKIKFICIECRKKKSIENRTRICPKCGGTVLHNSTTARKIAEDLKSVCKKCRSNQIPQILTYEQEQFLTGLMLGDGSIVYSMKIRSKHPRLCMSRQVQDKDYLFWQYEVFKDFYGTPPKFTTNYHNRVNKYYENFSCRTKTGQIFTDYYNKWYPNKKKIIPRDLILTPLILLIWFLDDGCIVKSDIHSLTIKISTDGFLKKDTEYLAQLLGSFIGEKINVYKNGNGFILKASTNAAVKFIKIIDPIFPSCMERKRTWKNFDWDYFNKNQHLFWGW